MKNKKRAKRAVRCVVKNMLTNTSNKVVDNNTLFTQVFVIKNINNNKEINDNAILSLYIPTAMPVNPKRPVAYSSRS